MRKIHLAGATLVVLCVAQFLSAASAKQEGVGIFDVCDYGAIVDGNTLNTTAIQAAIDACHQDSGGTVLIPSGDFVTGTGR